MTAVTVGERYLLHSNRLSTSALSRMVYPTQLLEFTKASLLFFALLSLLPVGDARDELVTLFFEEPFMQAIQTNCPWLLRYLVTAIILTKVAGDSPWSAYTALEATQQEGIWVLWLMALDSCRGLRP